MQLQIGEQCECNVEVVLEYNYNLQHEKKKDSTCLLHSQELLFFF